MDSGGRAGRRAVNLDKLIQDFISWQEAAAELLQENSQLSCQLKGAQKQCALHQQVAKANSEGTFSTFHVFACCTHA